MNAEWTNVIIGLVSLCFGAIGGLIAGVWRVARIEVRLKLYIHSTISSLGQKFEDKLEDSVRSFDETLRGLRQKVNDVEKDSLRLFVMKDDFNDFRVEYREDVRDIKASIENLFNAKYKA